MCPSLILFIRSVVGMRQSTAGFAWINLMVFSQRAHMYLVSKGQSSSDLRMFKNQLDLIWFHLYHRQRNSGWDTMTSWLLNSTVSVCESRESVSSSCLPPPTKLNHHQAGLLWIWTCVCWWDENRNRNHWLSQLAPVLPARKKQTLGLQRLLGQGVRFSECHQSKEMHLRLCQFSVNFHVLSVCSLIMTTTFWASSSAGMVRWSPSAAPSLGPALSLRWPSSPSSS